MRRERELEISILEDERHKTREKEHGKNYLLEAYLKGLPDAEDKQENAAGNSDSGVHTETAASPVINDDEAGFLPTIGDDERRATDMAMKKHHRRSRREHELMLEHQSTKEFSSAIKEEWKLDEASGIATSSATTAGIKDNGEQKHPSTVMTSSSSIDNEVAAQIDILEKLIVLNKHLQREEELCVRLSAKIKRYEADTSGFSESQVKDSLKRVNEQLEEKQIEIDMLEKELITSDDVLESKSRMLKNLYDECQQCDVEEKKSTLSTAPDVVQSSSVVEAIPPTKTEKFLSLKDDELGMSREYLAENIYNISKIILKSNGHPQNLMKSINQSTSGSTAAADANRFKLTDSSAPTDTPSTSNSTNHRQHQMSYNANSLDRRAPYICMMPTTSQVNLNPHAYTQQSCNAAHTDARKSSMNYLETINQRIQKINHLDTNINSLSNNTISQANLKYKLGPKKLLINTPNMIGNLNSVNDIYKRNIILPTIASFSSATNHGVDTVDASQLGTLV